MPQWQGKSRGNKLGYQIFVFVVSTLGVKPAYFLLRFVAFYFVLFSPASTPHIFGYFRKRHGYGFFQAAIHLYKNYYVFGQTLLDKIMVMAGVENKFTFQFDGVENLKEIVGLAKGGILLSGHVGNWEIAGQMLSGLNTKVNVVMFDGEHQQIKKYLTKVTDRTFNVIVMRDDLSHVYEIGQALQKNELVCMHADRFVPGARTFEKEFLGTSALFPQGPFAIASTFNVPVSFVFAFKETDRHYHFFGSKILMRTDGISKRDYSDRLASDFVSSLENKVRQYPDQWFNYYNFWETAA
jgi:predicted LPLAT superfamily acyltransferase